MYNNFNNNQNFNYQDHYNRTVAMIVFAPLKEAGIVSLKSSKNNILPMMGASVMSLLFALMFYLSNESMYGFIMSVPSVFFLVTGIIALSKLKTVKFTNDGINIKYTFSSLKHYSFSDITNLTAFPVMNINSNAFNAQYAQTPKNIIIFQFSDGKKFILPLPVISFAHIFTMLNSNLQPRFDSELQKIKQYFFDFNIDIESRTENFSSKKESPFEGF